MHPFTTYKEVRNQVKLEADRLLEVAKNKAQSIIMIILARPRMKNNKGAKRSFVSEWGGNKEKEILLLEEIR